MCLCFNAVLLIKEKKLKISVGNSHIEKVVLEVMQDLTIRSHGNSVQDKKTCTHGNIFYPATEIKIIVRNNLERFGIFHCFLIFLIKKKNK